MDQDDRDSLGSLTTLSEYSERSVTICAEMLPRVGELITPTDLAAQMARLNATFGIPRDRTADQVRVMAAEWFRALQFFGAKSLAYAVDNLIRNSKWWPTLSEVHALCKADHDGWEDALGLRPDPTNITRKRLQGKTFCRDGRTEAEEIAYRAAEVLRMKREAGFGSQADPLLEMQDKRMVKPAAQDDGYVSPQLKAIAQKNGFWRGAA